ncbi:cyclin-dependent kinase inhibitor 1-like [Ananas comosus]|uniref:Cyclin-dependent kinase inhibitor 1-like n=1 Tax=Ananas comosus TaxID=4615 RepID=A0A6P5F4K6_ANACO|nr:cyclin-dependent kinase inhibitor 1-like [Ananas comosus]
MGKYMKKCRGVGEVAAMEVTQVVGVRTRSRAAAAAAAAAAEEEEEAKKTKEAAAEGEVEGYLELRSRRLAMATRTPRSTANSGSGGGGGGGGCPSRASRGTISRCSSNASSAAIAALEAAAEEEIKDDARNAGPGEPEGCNDLGSSVSYTECSRERRETTPLSELRDAESEERRKRRRSREANAPSEAEIEEFFAAAESAEAERFATKYNFDVVNEVPLDGRYEWVRLSS